MLRYFLIYKPYGMLSQFSREGDHATLADLDFRFPKDVYPVGRLDADSEGLLLLTNNTKVNGALLNPKKGHERTYLVQVEGVFSPEAKAMLEKGVEINVNGKMYKTLPAKVEILANSPQVPERNPPIRVRLTVPDSWIKIQLTEGKNRQVRKMTAKVGFPTLRLIRSEIIGHTIEGMVPGEVREIINNGLIDY